MYENVRYVEKPPRSGRGFLLMIDISSSKVLPMNLAKNSSHWPQPLLVCSKQMSFYSMANFFCTSPEWHFAITHLRFSFIFGSTSEDGTSRQSPVNSSTF